ncbi:MAG: hypothetical protein JXJ04_07060 [Spirochaetales bacterium]|nr:hypothetical protein [Spirochaetales bacterium]
MNNIDWLLERNNYSVRYFTLIDIVGKSFTDSDVLEAKQHILNENPVKKILAKQNDLGCWGMHTCYRNVFWRLKALSAIPEKNRTENQNVIIQAAIEYILQHHIYKRSHSLTKIINNNWLSLIFPSIGELDFLQVLEVLADLKINDSRMNDAIELLVSKKMADNQWKLEKDLNGRIQVPLEKSGVVSKWITYKALKVLQHWNSG